MFDSLEVKVLCPRSGGDEGLARRKGGDREVPSERSGSKAVKANKGSPGVDGMTVEQLPDYLRAHWPQHREELLQGTYTPSPVRRVEIPKPDGGVRKLGVPTALDRFVQQAVLQVLQPIFDPTFSEHSYGFRPGRSAHQAVAAAQEHLGSGYRWVVDLDQAAMDPCRHQARVLAPRPRRSLRAPNR